MSSASVPEEFARGSEPAGDLYDWYRRGCQLLEDGHAAAAVQLLTRVSEREPAARHVRETLGRARLTARQYGEAQHDFEVLVALAPDDDYAHLGLGMALARQGRFTEAVEHLALAVAMRPDRPEYVAQLEQTRATVRARRDVARPPTGPASAEPTQGDR